MGTFMEYFNAFWVGGLICALCQILLDRTKMLPGRIMVTLVCTGAVLSFLGLYDPFAEYAGAGASVPLLGFGHLLFQGVKDAVKESGFLGLFQGGLKAGAVGTLNRSPSSRQLKKYKFSLPVEIYLLAVFMQLASKFHVFPLALKFQDSFASVYCCSNLYNLRSFLREYLYQ